MSDFTVYPRSMDFGTIPAGVQSSIQWAHLTNHDSGTLDRDDWGVNGPFISQRPALRQMSPAALTELRTNAPSSGDSRWVYGYGDYVFEGNTTTGIGVFKVDATGLAIQVSRYTSIVPSSTGGGFFHDGRFLYVRNSNGLHILKLDKYDNLILCDVIEPNAVTVECVHGYRLHVFTVDNVGITVLRVSHTGQATVVDSEALAGAIRVWARGGWVFAMTATALKSYKIDAAGFLTAAGTRALGAGAYENLTGDEKFVYVTDDTGTNDLYSLTIDEDGAFTVADSETLPAGTTHYGLYFDGGYLQALNGHQLNSYSVNRDTGVLNLVISNESYGPEELVDGDMEAGPGPEELVDGDMEAGPGPEELTDGDMEAGPGPEELVDGDMEAGPGPEELTDGDMEDTGVTAWSIGNSASLTKSTTSPHSGLRYLRVNYNGVTNPYAYQTVMSIGITYRVTGWAKGGGTGGVPYVADGGVTLWTGTSSTSWQAFDVTFVATSTQIEFRSTLAVGGYVGYDTCSIVGTCPDWTPGNSATLTKDTTSPHSGSQCLRVAYNGTSFPYAYQTTLLSGRTYRITGWARGDGTYAPLVKDASNTLWTGTGSTSWQSFDVSFVSYGTTIRLMSFAVGAGYAEFDDCSIVETCPDWTPGGTNKPLLTKSTASPHGGAQALRLTLQGTSGQVNQGSIMTVTRTYRVTGWARGDGASEYPRLTDSGTVIWTGTTSTSWQSIDVTFVCTGGQLRLDAPVGGSGTWVEFDDFTLKETCPDWIPLNNALLTKSTAGPHGGSQALRVAYNGTASPYAGQNILTIGHTYHVIGWGRGDGGSGKPRFYSGAQRWLGTTSTSWQSFDVTFVATSTSAYFFNFATTGWCEFDDVSIVETCPDWTPFSAAPPLMTKEAGFRTGGSGTQVLKIAYDAVSNPFAYQSIVTAGLDYRITGWVRGDGTNFATVRSSGTILFQSTTSTNWQYFDVVFNAFTADIRFYCQASSTGWVEFDDVSVKELDDSFYDAWFDGEKLITARLEDGIGVFGFDDSRIRFPVYYTPLGYSEYAGEISVQGVSIPLVGESPSSFDPYIIADSESMTLESDMRWDKITYLFYGSFDRLQDVKDANPQIPSEIKARLYVPRGTIVKRPTDSETESSSIGAVEWRRQ